ncbi:hypothetical protein B0G62_103169 [Paraburkholderia eburnea]|uniref:Uncharacterized protein n=1 Tax=Paraburkholderia eburnea TaxID=1189126 RepID=A0A2S4MGP7_9BURK|nr:hypothetical protein [Paraburkholderia eburnea]POR53597.1 hypothetical protein B0G62_103169 [Paraburkholderia eburnea]PRZ25565.1 hypothetical protein BX588_102169 [Paraburkholderia eburnea]
MDSEQNDVCGEAMVSRAQYEQLRREHGVLAIITGAFTGAYLYTSPELGPVPESVGWGVDPDSPDGSGTFVYLTPYIAGRKSCLHFPWLRKTR